MSKAEKFVLDLELADGDSSLQFEPVFLEAQDFLEATDRDSGIMNYRSLNSFIAGVSRQCQEDVLNSMLLAQRAANKAFPEDNQVTEWYKKYFEVLETIGWVFDSKDFKTFRTQHSQFDIENALLEILSLVLTGKQIDILMKTINAFKSLGSDDQRLKAFEKRTHSLQQGNFQLGVVSEEDHLLSMVVSAFILSSRKNITRILFFTSEKEAAQLSYISTNVTLNEAVYSPVRNAIKDKLGDISSFVADLPI